tara:strand:- start:165 stop:383 length:219 start_codon:yes stop_codon:yes gene_type:complete
MSNEDVKDYNGAQNNWFLLFRRLYMRMNLILLLLVLFTFTAQAHHESNLSEVKVIFAEESEEKPTEEEPDCE